MCAGFKRQRHLVTALLLHVPQDGLYEFQPLARRVLGRPATQQEPPARRRQPPQPRAAQPARGIEKLDLRRLAIGRIAAKHGLVFERVGHRVIRRKRSETEPRHDAP